MRASSQNPLQMCRIFQFGEAALDTDLRTLWGMQAPYHRYACTLKKTHVSAAAEYTPHTPHDSSSRDPTLPDRLLAATATGTNRKGVVKTVTQFAAFIECGVGRPTRRLRRDGQPMVMEPVDGFLAKEDLPENAALSEQLVKTQEQTSVISQGERIVVAVVVVVVPLLVCGWGLCLLWTLPLLTENVFEAASLPTHPRFVHDLLFALFVSDHRTGRRQR